MSYSDVNQITESTVVCMTPTGNTSGMFYCLNLFNQILYLHLHLGTFKFKEEEALASNNSVQPERRLNYKGDYKDNVRPICTKDLLTWAFQVARGMEYLASRKVIFSSEGVH